MSELKAIESATAVIGNVNLVYIKEDADKVITKIVEGAISMFRHSACCRGLDLKSSLGKIADAAFKHWNYVESIQRKCIQLESDINISRQIVYLVKMRATKQLLEQATKLRHQKYKRCLTMARWCASRATVWSIDGNEKKADWYWYWDSRWKELAEKFKDINYCPMCGRNLLEE